MTKDAYGVFEIIVPAKDGKAVIPHKSTVKVSYYCFNVAHYPSLTGACDQDLPGPP